MKPAGLFRKAVIAAMIVLLSVVLSAVSCDTAPDLDESLGDITDSHRFSILGWEITALPKEIGDWFIRPSEDDGVATVRQYFDNAARISSLEAALSATSGDLTSQTDELADLREENRELAPVVERVLAGQIGETLAGHGIYNPLVPVKISFPPVNFSLEPPPHLLVISPWDRIESMREVRLAQSLDPETVESIEAAAAELGVSALVVELGGFGGTYPTFVADSGGLRYTIETAVEEWLHQYLTFTPLGYRYLLDVTGISLDYEIATMNETVAGIVSGEIGAEVYRTYYAGGEDDQAGDEYEDFNRAMRETRLVVDELLAEGKIEEAESYMEQRRQYILSLGYYIRKLNQAYFAFHGTYADSQTSVDPIGEELKELRAHRASVEDFLATVTQMTGRADLQRVLGK